MLQLEFGKLSFVHDLILVHSCEHLRQLQAIGCTIRRLCLCRSWDCTNAQTCMVWPAASMPTQGCILLWYVTEHAECSTNSNKLHLVICFVTEQSMNQQICHIFSVNGATHLYVLSKHPSACGRLSLQASWPDDCELHVSTYALHRTRAVDTVVSHNLPHRCIEHL